jgi:ABC-type multidrug transport system fused ATPase/permease subunit
MCSSLRLLGQYCTEPQGLFEPEVCPQGMFCPSLSHKLVCPSGSFCPLGSTAPILCSSFSICAEGSHRELFFGPAALSVGIDVAIIALLLLARALQRRSAAAGARLLDGSNNIAPLPQQLSSSELTHQLVARIRTACGFSDGGAVARPSVDISFEGVTLALGGKAILQDVGGRASSGKLTALMGGSGSGKSTLLHCLRGRSIPDSGSITINGAVATLQDIQHMVGFCAQDDDVFLLPTLTVEETLKFAAVTRMPRSCSASDRAAYVETLILKLGLHRVRGSLVGSYGGSRQVLQCSLPFII